MLFGAGRQSLRQLLLLLHQGLGCCWALAALGLTRPVGVDLAIGWSLQVQVSDHLIIDRMMFAKLKGTVQSG